MKPAPLRSGPSNALANRADGRGVPLDPTATYTLRDANGDRLSNVSGRQAQLAIDAGLAQSVGFGVVKYIRLNGACATGPGNWRAAASITTRTRRSRAGETTEHIPARCAQYKVGDAAG